MKCEKCERKVKNLTELKMFFDITNPDKFEIECKNNYEKLSMADTINFRKALHTVLDVSLDKISTLIFAQNVKSAKHK